MKATPALTTAVALLAASAFAQSDVILKQRARDINAQNNVRQGVTPPSQPSQPSQPGPASASTAPSTVLQQSLAKVRADLAAIKVNVPVTAQQKQQLARDLLASAQGASKPSQSTIGALAESLAAAFVQKPLSEADRNRLVSDLAAVLNPAKIQPAQINGVARKDALKIVDQVKALAAETQRSPG